DQVTAGHLAELATRKDAQLLEQLAVGAGDRRLTGTGSAREDQVLADRTDRQARARAPPVDLDLVDQRVHVGLHAVQADHGVQLGQQLVESAAATCAAGHGSGDDLGRRGRVDVDARIRGVLRGAGLQRPAAACTDLDADTAGVPHRAVPDGRRAAMGDDDARLAGVADPAAFQQRPGMLVDVDPALAAAGHRAGLQPWVGAAPDDHTVAADIVDRDVVDGARATLDDQAVLGPGDGDVDDRARTRTTDQHAGTRARVDRAVLDGELGVVGVDRRAVPGLDRHAVQGELAAP